MLTRKIDAALDARDACRAKVPVLASCYLEGSPERAVVETFLAALADRDAALLRRHAQPPRPVGTWGA